MEETIIEDITGHDMDKFLAVHSKQKGVLVTGFIKANIGIASALSSDIGKDILKESLSRMNYLLEKIVDNSIDDEERVEYKILRSIITKWADKINNWNKVTKGIKLSNRT
jgi:hypothetical protein